VDPQVQVHQPQRLQQGAGSVSSKGAAVQPDVDQPVVFIVRFFGRCVEQEPAVGFFPFQPNPGFERTDMIEPQCRHAVQFQERYSH
jgi:hypothetical protein